MKMRFTALGVGIVVVIAAWFLFAFKPAQSELSEVRSDVDTATEQVAALQTRLQKLQALQNNEGELRDKAEAYATALPAEPDVSDFILQVQEAANLAGIDFLSVTPSLPAAPTSAASSSSSSSGAAASQAAGDGAATAQTPTSPYQSITVQITADGPFFELEDFVSRLESLQRALRIDDFSLSSSDNTTSSPVLSLSMKLQMFMLSPANAGTSTTTTTTS